MAFSHWLFFRNFPSQVFDRVLNMPVDYLSCFAVILRGMHKKVDICQIDYSIHSKLRIFSYSEVIHGNTTFKLTKGQQRLKKMIKYSVLVLSFVFFVPMSQTISVINRNGACTLQTSGACAGVYECDRTHQMEKTTAADHITLKFLKAVFNKFHLIHS